MKRPNMTTRWYLIPLLAVPTALAAQELTGPQPDHGLGFTLTIPTGWVGTGGPEGYLIGHATVPGAIMVSAVRHANLEALTKAFSEPTADGTSDLSVQGEPVVGPDNSVKVVQVGTMQGTPVKVVGCAQLNPYGGYTANLIALAPEETFSAELEAALERTFRSVRYTTPNTAYQGAGKEDRAWHDRLAGARLTYMESYSSPSATEGGIGGGYSLNRRIDLCPAGRYTTRTDSDHTLSGGEVSAYDQTGSGNEGRWSTVRLPNGDTVLRLTPTQGAVQEYRLTDEGGKTYLDGARWYRTTLADDGPEYAPDCP
jgi:hypothetical protein